MLRITDAQRDVPVLNKWAKRVDDDLAQLRRESQKHFVASASLKSEIGTRTIPANANDPTGVSGSVAPITIDGQVYCQVTINYTSPNPLGTFAGVFLGVSGYNGSTQIVKVAEDNFTSTGGVAQTFKTILNRTGETITCYIIPKNTIEAALANWGAAPNFTLSLTGSVTAPAAPTGLLVSAKPLGNTLVWNGNSEGNMQAYTVYRNTVNTFGTATKIGTVAWAANTVGGFVDKAITVVTTYYYWITATNNAGLESSPSTVQNTLAIAASLDTDVADGTTTGRVAQLVYTMPASTGTAWFLLGTWVFQNFQGHSMSIVFHTGTGFNSNSTQQAVTTLTLRSGNGTAAPNISGACFVTSGGTSPVLAVKVVATGGSTSVSNTSWDIYIETGAFATGHCTVSIQAPGDSFTFNGATTTDPGAASSTVVVATGGKLIDENSQIWKTFNLKPVNNACFVASGSTLTQSGTSTTINVASGSMQWGSGTVSYNSGSVNPGGYGKYYIYCDDPLYVGGAVTYVATTSAVTVFANDGRIYFGSITTAAGGGGTGGGAGSGSGYGGSGRQL